MNDPLKDLVEFTFVYLLLILITHQNQPSQIFSKFQNRERTLYDLKVAPNGNSFTVIP